MLSACVSPNAATKIARSRFDMFEYPQFEEDGQEKLFFPNVWRKIESQEVLGTDCFNPYVDLKPTDNLVSLRLTADEFKEMLSALYNGAVMTYPDTFLQIIANFLRGIHCDPLIQEDECTEYPTYASFMHYSPANPFVDPEAIPDGYLAPPFLINGRDGNDVPNYEVDDILVPLDAITLDGDWFATLDGQLPTITIDVNGSGTVQVRLLNQVAGGLAVITLDEPPNLLDIIIGVVTGADNIVDLNLDAVSIPPETAIEIDFPVEIAEVGAHTIYVIYLPILDDSLIPVRFGGGYRGVNLCDFAEVPVVSCEDVEDCLEESEIIANINTEITNIENSVTVINEQIEGIDDCGCGGNVYPPDPENYDQPSPIDPEKSGICNAAYYIVDQLWLFMYTIAYTDPIPSYIEWLNAMLGATGYVAELLRQFWDLLIANPDLEALENAINDSKEELAELFFCNLLNRDAVRDGIVASSMDEIAKEYWLAALDATSDAKLNQWAFLGAETGESTCFHMCNWTVVWDFSGTYVPVGGEDAIYSGDTWEVVNGEYNSGVGYTGLLDSWYITHPLPPDCAVVSMVHNCNKNELCSAVDISSTWRGTSGTDPEELSPEARVLSNTPVDQNWTVYSAVLDHMTFVHNHFFCGGDNYGSQSHWVKMTGTGSRPSA